MRVRIVASEEDALLLEVPDMAVLGDICKVLLNHDAFVRLCMFLSVARLN
jgi:hypothetical protein